MTRFLYTVEVLVSEEEVPNGPGEVKAFSEYLAGRIKESVDAIGSVAIQTRTLRFEASEQMPGLYDRASVVEESRPVVETGDNFIPMMSDVKTEIARALTVDDRGLARPPRNEAGELEPGYEISSRFQRHQIDVVHRKTPKHARCAQCNERLALTDDPIENHHIAMRHKEVCRRDRADLYPPEQLEQLIQEFNRQPHVIALKKQHTADLERMKLEAGGQLLLEERTIAAEAKHERGLIERFKKWLRRQGA